MIGVAFGLDGTLGFDNRLYSAAIERLVLDLYHERSETPDGRLLRAIVQTIPDSIRRPDEHGSLELLCQLFGQSRNESRVKARFRGIARNLVDGYFTPNAQALATLAALREMHVPSAILSDGWNIVEQRKAELLAFDGTLVVGESLEGHPDGRSLTAFVALSDALRLPADCIWFVGSDPYRDMLPAHAAGFRTVWLNRLGRTFPKDLPAPEHAIRGLRGLLRVIGRPYMQAALMMSKLVTMHALR